MFSKRCAIPFLLQASFVEEEIDRMNESFLRLSVELQNRTRLSLQPREGDGSVGNHSAVISSKTASIISLNNSFLCYLATLISIVARDHKLPELIFTSWWATACPLPSIILQQATAESVPGPSRNGTILLEVRRRRVSQRLNELEITLGQIRGCQRRDSQSKEGMRGHAYVDGGRPSSGRGLDGVQASWSRSRKSVTGASLGNRDLESHISRHREGDDLDSSGIQRTESDMKLNVSGQQERNGRIPIENTSGHTDTDAM